MRYRNKASISVVCCLSVLLLALPAYAYVDPNAAGLVSQTLTPLLIAGGAALTFFRRQIGAAFTGISRRFRRRNDA